MTYILSPPGALGGLGAAVEATKPLVGDSTNAAQAFREGFPAALEELFPNCTSIKALPAVASRGGNVCSNTGAKIAAKQRMDDAVWANYPQLKSAWLAAQGEPGFLSPQNKSAAHVKAKCGCNSSGSDDGMMTGVLVGGALLLGAFYFFKKK